ncbi:hypothetical protein ACFPRL_09850 [Pseudoclavibacter helvolus]
MAHRLRRAVGVLPGRETLGHPSRRAAAQARATEHGAGGEPRRRL